MNSAECLDIVSIRPPRATLLIRYSSLLSVKSPLPNDGKVYTYAQLRGAQKTCSTSELVDIRPKIDPTGVE